MTDFTVPDTLLQELWRTRGFQLRALAAAEAWYQQAGARLPEGVRLPQNLFDEDPPPGATEEYCLALAAKRDAIRELGWTDGLLREAYDERVNNVVAQVRALGEQAARFNPDTVAPAEVPYYVKSSLWDIQVRLNELNQSQACLGELACTVLHPDVSK